MRHLLVLLPIALLLAACGGSEEEAEQTGSVLRTVQISETEFALDPSTVNLSKPGTYEFRATNDGQITHALEIEGNGIEEETQDIEPDGTMSLRVTLSKTGSYEMYCPIGNHREQGMDGTITVGAGGTGAGATTNEDETTTGQTTTTGY